MATILDFPSAGSSQARLLEQAVQGVIAQHPDPQVAQRWMQMARESLLRYSGPPLPSNPILDLGGVNELTAKQREQVQDAAERWLTLYFDDVRNQLMNVHQDLMVLQKRVAELEVLNQNDLD